MRRRAGEIDRCTALVGTDRNFHADGRAVVHLVTECTILQRADHASHAFLGVVLHVLHIRIDHVETEMRHHAAQFLYTFFIGRDLCTQVGDVLVGITRRIFGAGKARTHLGFKHHTVLNQLDVVQQYAFVLHRFRKWRHGSRCNAANVGVMPPRTDIEQNAFIAFIEHRRHHRHIRQMGTTVERIIQHVHIARPDLACVFPHDRLDAFAHRAQMHRHVRSVRDEIAIGIEQSATEIQPFLDIDRVRRIG